MSDENRTTADEPASREAPRLLGPALGAPLAAGEATSFSGEIAGRYRVVGELGRGQFGVVYRAEQIALARPVAIKVPRMDSQRAIERFLREGRLLAKLSHPNLVRVLDADTCGGRPYLVLEFVLGWPLSELLERRARLPLDEALPLARQVAEALACAHAAGVIHRDVKTANVLVTADGVAKLADFGLARGADTEAGLTVAGGMIGTPNYMAPELVRGQPATAAADLYALGVTLFELVAGHVPFTGASPAELLTRTVQEPPPLLSSVVPDVPPAVDELVLALLAKNPKDRPAGEEAAARLRVPGRRSAAPGPSASTGSSSSAVPDTPASYLPLLLLVLGFFALFTRCTNIKAKPETPARSPRATPAPRWTPLKPLPPARDGLERWLSETDGAEMVHVPAGPFRRGTDELDPNTRPVRTITLSGYWIDRYEVTNQLWDKFCRATHRPPRALHDGDRAELDRPDHPVVFVTHDDARAYAAWAGKRLPTEAEWEKAARGPQGQRFPWGAEEPGARRPCNYSDPLGGNTGQTTSPVGRYRDGASPFGAFDMAGNAWEWCEDWYDATYYATCPDRDPPGPAGPTPGGYRVKRGGSYLTVLVRDLEGAQRKFEPPGARLLDQGFRCVRPDD